MERDRYPLVSIGVPVFNGERGLPRCLDSLLQQDYPNLEIIISDNASTDATASICRQYASRDSRIKYWRSERNTAAYPNFSRVFELSSGKYFMWAAHDDDRHPSFVGVCVERLEQCPDAVLCQPHTAVFIEGHEEMLYVARLDSFERTTGIVDRYRETLKRFPATAMYGVYRRSAVCQTRLLEPILGSDVAFIQELSIYGRFVQVPKVLFSYRARRKWNTLEDDQRRYVGSHPESTSPFLALLRNHCTRLLAAPISRWTKLRLLGVLAAHTAEQLALKTFLRLAGAVCPETRKPTIGRTIYRRWMQNANLTVVSGDLFLERVCKPQLGWWR